MRSLITPLSGLKARPPAAVFALASDARLVALAAAGSEGAMAAIFERHHQPLQRYCHSILGNADDAADALQNTMIRALRALPGETRQITLRPWLYRIAHNESISLLRARRPDSDLDAAAHVGDAAAAGAVESRERLRTLTQDLSELTERQRGALLMRELGGLQFTEVAQALGTSASAAKQSVYEARCALQAMQEGRAMECEAVRRTLSDGDRRVLRGMRMRGHLRDCAGCCEFELAMHRRPQELRAINPPLSVAAAAAMLHGILGSASGGGGGGLAAGLAGSAKATTGLSLAAKAAAVVAVSGTLAGGAIYAVPRLAQAPERPAPQGKTIDAANTSFGIRASGGLAALRRRLSAGTAANANLDRLASPAAADPAGVKPSAATKPVQAAAATPAGAVKPAGSGGASSGAAAQAATPAASAGAGQPAGATGAAPSVAGEPAAAKGGKARKPGGRRRGPGRRRGGPSGKRKHPGGRRREAKAKHPKSPHRPAATKTAGAPRPKSAAKQPGGKAAKPGGKSAKPAGKAAGTPDGKPGPAARTPAAGHR